jgi:hypothetical protein
MLRAKLPVDDIAVGMGDGSGGALDAFTSVLVLRTHFVTFERV